MNRTQVAHAMAITTWLLLFPTGIQSQVRIFVLLGDSNMKGHGSYSNLHQLAETDPEYAYLLDTDGEFKTRSDVRLTFNEAGIGNVSDLSVGYGLNKTFGPEIGFGKEMGDYFYNDPVLLVKCASGGTHLGIEWRSPTALQRDYSEAGIIVSPHDYGKMWRTMVEMIDDVTMNVNLYVPGYNEDEGYSIEGIVWMQGWNDAMNDNLRNDYEENLKRFIHDLNSMFGENTRILVLALGQLGINPANYAFESLLLGPIMKAQENVARESGPQVDLMKTSQYTPPVDTMNIFTPADGAKFDSLHHYFGRADTIMNIGYAAARVIIQDIRTSVPSSATPSSLVPTVPNRKPRHGHAYYSFWE